jgi:hypothetical protein
LFYLEKKIYAHKSILYARSEHLSALVSGGMLESTLTQIQLNDFKYEVYLALLEYMYVSLDSKPLEIKICMLTCHSRRDCMSVEILLDILIFI